MLRIKIPYLLGIAQINLALLSLRCGVVSYESFAFTIHKS